MKRSSKLLATTLLAGSAIALAGCKDEEIKNFTFTDVETCYVNQPADQTATNWREVCDDAFEDAQKRHEQEAPRYELAGSNGADLCEEMHGNGQCQRYTDNQGNSWFVPFMSGYLVSSLLNDNGQRIYSTSQARPMYRTYDGYYTNGARSYSTKSVNNSTGTRSSVVPTNYSSKPTTMTRTTVSNVKSSGGFGASRTTTTTRVSSGT